MGKFLPELENKYPEVKFWICPCSDGRIGLDIFKKDNMEIRDSMVIVNVNEIEIEDNKIEPFEVERINNFIEDFIKGFNKG